MKILLLLTSVMAVCLSMPFSSLQKSKVQAVRGLSNQNKRFYDSETVVLNHMDSNEDGIITGDEYATFYSTPIMIIGLLPDFQYSQLKYMFDIAAPVVDTHNTPNTLELDEYLKLNGGTEC